MSVNQGLICIASYPGLPDFSRATLKNMGRPGYEARFVHVYMDVRLGPSTSVRIIAKSAFQGVRNKGFRCNSMSGICRMKL